MARRKDESPAISIRNYPLKRSASDNGGKRSLGTRARATIDNGNPIFLHLRELLPPCARGDTFRAQVGSLWLAALSYTIYPWRPRAAVSVTPGRYRKRAPPFLRRRSFVGVVRTDRTDSLRRWMILGGGRLLDSVFRGWFV